MIFLKFCQKCLFLPLSPPFLSSFVSLEEKQKRKSFDECESRPVAASQSANGRSSLRSRDYNALSRLTEARYFRVTSLPLSLVPPDRSSPFLSRLFDFFCRALHALFSEFRAAILPRSTTAGKKIFIL